MDSDDERNSGNVSEDGDSDGDVDHEFDHEGDFDHDHDVDHEGGGGPGMFSVRSIAMMISGFGGVGFLIMKYTGNILFASVGGVAFGWFAAFIFILILRLFHHQQGSSLKTKGEYMRAQGMVTTTIPAKGFGEVSLTVAGRTTNNRASSSSNSEIGFGTRIKVIEYGAGTVIVEPITS